MLGIYNRVSGIAKPKDIAAFSEQFLTGTYLVNPQLRYSYCF